MSQLNLLNNLSRSELVLKPFPHFVVHDALNHDVYSALDESYPDNLLLSDRPEVINDRNHTRRLMYKNFSGTFEVNQLWQEFARIHTSTKFFRALTNFFFQEPISDLYPGLSKALDKFPVGLRTNNPNIDAKRFVTDFQFVSNLPVNDSHTSRTPHLDNPKEIYACLFYMKQKNDLSIGGGLDLYRPKKDISKIVHNSERAVDSINLEHAKTIHYASNTLVIFLNTITSYHGVQSIFEQNTTRRSINIIGELPFGHSLFDLKE